MSRRAGRPGGTVYLIHFDRPFKHARHYTGWTSGRLEDRLELHRRGQGARLMAVIAEAGIGWQLARTWEGSRRRERQIKRQGGASRCCPLCGVTPRRPAPRPSTSPAEPGRPDSRSHARAEDRPGHNSKKPYCERTPATSCYGEYDPCRPLCVRRRPGQVSDLDMTCMTSVYSGRRPGTAPARRHANRLTTGHDWTLSTVSSTTRTEARKAPRKTRTAPRRTPSPDNRICTCPRSASLVWPPGSARSRITTYERALQLSSIGGLYRGH